jgi:hypothetical protein
MHWRTAPATFRGRLRIPSRWHSIVSVLDVAHGAEREIDFAVQVLVAILDDMLENADHFVGDSVDAHLLAERVLAGKQFFLYIRTQDRDAAVIVLVQVSEKGAELNVHAAHARIVGINSADAVAAAAGSESGRLFRRLWRNP